MRYEQLNDKTADKIHCLNTYINAYWKNNLKYTQLNQNSSLFYQSRKDLSHFGYFTENSIQQQPKMQKKKNVMNQWGRIENKIEYKYSVPKSLAVLVTSQK